MLLFAVAIAGQYSSKSFLTIVPIPSADSLETRQIGSIKCNVDRLKTVRGLGKAKGAVKALAQNATYSILRSL